MGLCNLAAQLDGLARVCWLRAARARIPIAPRRTLLQLTEQRRVADLGPCKVHTFRDRTTSSKDNTVRMHKGHNPSIPQIERAKEVFQFSDVQRDGHGTDECPSETVDRTCELD